jgi:hypothetical protein
MYLQHWAHKTQDEDKENKKTRHYTPTNTNITKSFE